MLHEILKLTRPLFCIDAETTGINPEKDRIVEYGFQQWTSEGLVKEWHSLINPEIPIPPNLAKVHNITDEQMSKCRECGEAAVDHVMGDHEYKPMFRWRDIAANLANGFTNCDFAGKNVRFDLRITAAEMARAGVQWSYTGARIIDADRLEQLAVPRTLSDLHQKYVGYPHDGAHGAMSDVRASTTVIVKQFEAHPITRDLDQLHELQWPGWLCQDGRFRMLDGVPTCMFGKHKGMPMNKIPRDYYDWILRPSTDMPEDIKALARAAKLGNFPTGVKDGD